MTGKSTKKGHVRHAGKRFNADSSWQPGGHRLVFSMYCDERQRNQPYECDPDTTNAPTLVPGQPKDLNVTDAAWAPGGRAVISLPQKRSEEQPWSDESLISLTERCRELTPVGSPDELIRRGRKRLYVASVTTIQARTGSRRRLTSAHRTFSFVHARIVPVRNRGRKGQPAL